MFTRLCIIPSFQLNLTNMWEYFGVLLLLEEHVREAPVHCQVLASGQFARISRITFENTFTHGCASSLLSTWIWPIYHMLWECFFWCSRNTSEDRMPVHWQEEVRRYLAGISFFSLEFNLYFEAANYKLTFCVTNNGIVLSRISHRIPWAGSLL